MKNEKILRKKEAVSMDSLIQDYIRDMKIAAGLNRQRAALAWAEASGAGRYTLTQDFRNWRLYVTLSSSVVRSRLYSSKEIILQKINAILANDNLFSPPADGSAPVKDIILR